MVLGVCRRVLGDAHDAEDAFQATFLVLARKAGSIRKAASVASWLHGVACRAALKARARSATRRKHEARAPAGAAPEPDDLSWHEVRRALHEELDGLSDRYRVPLVLCYLEGKTQDQAAGQKEGEASGKPFDATAAQILDQERKIKEILARLQRQRARPAPVGKDW